MNDIDPESVKPKPISSTTMAVSKKASFIGRFESKHFLLKSKRWFSSIVLLELKNKSSPDALC